MKATKEGKLIKTTGDILGDPKVQKTIKSMVKSLLPITGRTQYCFVDCGKEICKCKPTKKIQMNKEKTAIQLLLEDIDSYVSKIPSSNVIGRVQRGLCGDIKRMAIESLKKEQEQIEKAFYDGYRHEVKPTVPFDYYQYKYGGEDVD